MNTTHPHTPRCKYSHCHALGMFCWLRPTQGWMLAAICPHFLPWSPTSPILPKGKCQCAHHLHTYISAVNAEHGLVTYLSHPSTCLFTHILYVYVLNSTWGNLGKVNIGNLDVTLTLRPGVVDFYLPQAKETDMSIKAIHSLVHCPA